MSSQLPNPTLTARQGGKSSVTHLITGHSSQNFCTAPCEMVHDPFTSRQSQDHQRRLTASAVAAYTHVQFPGIQRLAKGTVATYLQLCQCDFAPDTKVVYRRYASLFFIAGCASTDNELVTLEIVHRYVEQMDKYYGNVCELDIIFNFQKAYFILDELLLAGELQESSKKNVLRCISQQDSLEDMEVRTISAISYTCYIIYTCHTPSIVCYFRCFWNLSPPSILNPSSRWRTLATDSLCSFQVDEEVTKIM